MHFNSNTAKGWATFAGAIQNRAHTWLLEQFDTFEQRAGCERILSSHPDDVLTDAHPTAGALATLVDLAFVLRAEVPAAEEFLKAIQSEWAHLVAEHRIDCDACIDQDKRESNDVEAV